MSARRGASVHNLWISRSFYYPVRQREGECLGLEFRYHVHLQWG